MVHLVTGRQRQAILSDQCEQHMQLIMHHAYKWTTYTSDLR